MAELENFIYLQKQNIIFAYVPKVACTNWKCIFRYLEGHKDYLDNQLAHDRKNSGLIYLSECQNKDELLADKGIKKLSFVRSPKSRILSAYRNKIEPYALGARDTDIENDFWAKVYSIIHTEIHQGNSQEKVSFYDFLIWLESSTHSYVKNEHWLPQYQLVSPDKIDYDFIGRFEDIEEDAKILLNKLDCDITFPSQKDVRFPGTGASQLVENYFTEEISLLVERLYQKDFEFFSYN